MDDMNRIISLLVFAGMAVVFYVGRWYFTKHIPDLIELKVKLRHDKDLEQFKQELKASKDAEMAKLKHGYNEQLEKLKAQLQTDSLKSKEEMEHDRKIFARLMEYCDEVTFRRCCSSIGDHGFYENMEYIKLLDLEQKGVREENQFVNPDLCKAFVRFHETLDAFTNIVALNFFNVGSDRYLLHPENKHGDNDGRKIYEDARCETENATDLTLESFSAFRQAVKQILYV